MRVTKEQKDYCKTLSKEDQNRLLLRLYTNGYFTIRQCCACFSLDSKDVVGLLKANDVLRCSNPNCKQPVKSWSEFSDRTKHGVTGKQSICKVCRKEYNDQNKEKIHDHNIEHYQENKDDLVEYQKIYHKENKDNPKIKERKKTYMKKYNVLKKEEKQQYYKKRYAEKLDMYRANSVKYRTVRSESTPSYADQEKINDIYKECKRVSEETGILHHVDHIVPLQGNNVCGFHVEYNLQILEAKENLSKGNNFQDYDIVSSA